MIQITLKAKHYYYIVRFLKNYSLEQYFDLFSRIKTSIENNTNDEAQFGVLASVQEIVSIYKILTYLPEGQSNTINTEMAEILQTLIQQGVSQEISNGITDGDWSELAKNLTIIKDENTAAREADILTGKNLINVTL